jgi:3-oxoacyl-[acyl-carrier protein] reductase
LQLEYPDESKLSFSGDAKVLQPADVTADLLPLMAKRKDLICIPESRGLLSKIAEIWPAVGELFCKNLERKGAESIKKFRTG